MYQTCAKRALPCNLGCGLILRAEQWAAEGVRKRHNTVECPKRRVECPRDCGQARFCFPTFLRIQKLLCIATIHATRDTRLRFGLKLLCDDSRTPVLTIASFPRAHLPISPSHRQAVVFDAMQEHLDVLCPKRPVPPLPCRLGCGLVFKGGWDQLLQLEEARTN